MSSPAPAPPRPALRRRDLLTGGLAALAVTTAAGETARSLWGTAAARGPVAEPAGDGPVHMQIVAHPDDCLYFINPRIARALAAGAGTCTVVLTAGEADGKNTRDGEAHPDFAGYAAARNTGLRRAYAHMATGDAASPWRRECARLDSGQLVEACVLEGRPDVHLIFCSLWTNLGRLTGDYTRLLALWQGDIDASLVLPPTGSDLAETTVDRATIRDSLLELLDTYRPAVVNTLDPDPDPVVGERLGAEQPGFADHIDHTAAALFAWDAVREWGQAAAVESWRGYYNRRWPANLGAPDREIKGAALNVYSWADATDCGEATGCGDRVVIGPGTGDTYGLATHPRYATSIAAARTEIGPAPAAVTGTRLRLARGQGWTDLGGPDLLPTVAAAGARLFAVSPDHTPEPDRHVRAVHCFDLAAGDWTDLGNPAGTGTAARAIGSPAAADNGDAALVAVRGPAGGLHVRTKPNGRDWTAWTHLSGPAVHDAPAAVARADGRFAVYAATPDGAAAWELRGRHWRYRDLDLPHLDGHSGHRPAGALAAAPTGDGRVLLASRAAGSADITLHLGDGRAWTAALLRLEGGILAPAVACGPDGTVAVAADDGAGAIAAVTVPLAAIDAGGARPLEAHWSRGDLVAVKRPALAFDDDARLLMWAAGPDGAVRAAASAPGDRPATTWAPAMAAGD